MKPLNLLALMAMACLGISCGGVKQKTTDASQLVEADRAFCRATAEKGLEGWLSFFHPQAAIFPAGRAAVSGFDSITAYYQQVRFDPKPLNWEPARAELAESGEMGFTYGYWKLPGKDKKGKDIVYQGKYLTVWKKDPNGDWKVFADIGTN